MGSYPAQNSALMEALASHGYIAISMAHAGDTPAIVFENGQTEIYPPLPPSGDDLSRARSARFLAASYDERLEGLLVSERIARGGGDPLADRAAIWLQDRLFLSRTLREGGMPAAARVVLGAADVNRIVHAGMSFGGSMSVSACGLDPACEAAINLDGGDYHFSYLDAATPHPLLMLHADWTVGPLPPGITRHPPHDMAFNDFSYEPFDTAGADRNVYRMRVRGVTHTGLSDFGLMLRQPLRGPLAGDIPGDMLAAVLNDTVIGFLDAHVKRATNGFPEAVYSKHAARLAPHDASGVRLWWSRKSEMERNVLRTAVRSLSAPPPTVAGMITETE
jgi:predicted dienelactone hydrolase